MADLSSYSPNVKRQAWVDWLLSHDRYNLYEWFGGRGAAFYASFKVRNGAIWREGSGVGLVVSSRKKRSDDAYERTLFVNAESRQRLHPTIEHPFGIMGSDEQLALHPYYKAGRPGGCKINCQMAVASYSTRTPPAEIERLTSFDLSCFTRFTPCAELGDVLPAAREWRLYEADESNPVVLKPGLLPMPCDIPVWALARDARYILSVEALSRKNVTEDGIARELSNVRVVASLKEPAPWLPGAVAVAYPFPGDLEWSAAHEAEHLVPGKRFLVFPVGNDRRDQRLTKDSAIRLDRCGVQEDSPETRLEIEKGVAQNDSLTP